MTATSTARAVRKSGKAAILTYHSLDETSSVISIAPSLFRRQMEALAAAGTPVVPLSEIRTRPGAVALTFDDGFVSFAEHALPVLQRLSFPATVFVVSGHCGKYNDWPSQSPGIPRLPLMSWSLLRDLPHTVSVGAHTVTHPYLRTLEDRDMQPEVARSRAEIEQEIGRAVTSFAYPYGSVDMRVASVVRKEFSVGCGTRLHFIGPGSDPVVLPRLDAYYLKSPVWWHDHFGAINGSYVALWRCLRTFRAWRRGR